MTAGWVIRGWWFAGLLACLVALNLSQAPHVQAQEGTEVIALERPIHTQHFGLRDTVPHGLISAGVGTIIASNLASSIGGLTALIALTWPSWLPRWIRPGEAVLLSCFAPIVGPIAYGVAAIEDGYPGIALFSFGNALAQAIGVVVLIVGGVDQHNARLALTAGTTGLTLSGTF